MKTIELTNVHPPRAVAGLVLASLATSGSDPEVTAAFARLALPSFDPLAGVFEDLRHRPAVARTKLRALPLDTRAEGIGELARASAAREVWEMSQKSCGDLLRTIAGLRAGMIEDGEILPVALKLERTDAGTCQLSVWIWGDMPRGISYPQLRAKLEQRLAKLGVTLVRSTATSS